MFGNVRKEGKNIKELQTQNNGCNKIPKCSEALTERYTTILSAKH